MARKPSDRSPQVQSSLDRIAAKRRAESKIVEILSALSISDRADIINSVLQYCREAANEERVVENRSETSMN